MLDVEPEKAMRKARAVVEKIFPEYFQADETGEKSYAQTEILSVISEYSASILYQMCVDRRVKEREVTVEVSPKRVPLEKDYEAADWEVKLVRLQKNYPENKFVQSLWTQYNDNKNQMKEGTFPYETLLSPSQIEKVQEFKEREASE